MSSQSNWGIGAAAGWALLVGIYRGKEGRLRCQEHLEELESLADTFGIDVIAKMPCSVRKIEAATFLTRGKLQEVAELVQEHKATLVIFDDEISPAQQRNLEKQLKVAVMDRTELILEIFAARAETKEAALQIELAKIQYEFPRLKRLWSHFSRQRMSGGYLKGEGEKQIEIDRRLLQRRVDRLEKELAIVRKTRATQKALRVRSRIPTFALVGYTNAGKSTLLNALTEAKVFVEDKLFATLDPTTRKFTLPNNQEILLTDTVGFIRKLPHNLVAAFRSTLEAALHDDFLLHLVDASHPNAEEHAEATLTLLEELDASDTPRITVLNKCDAVEDEALLQRLKIKLPKVVVISAKDQTGFEDLYQLMIKELKDRVRPVKLKIPQHRYELVSEVKREGHVLHEEYVENDVILRAEVPVSIFYKIQEFIIN